MYSSVVLYKRYRGKNVHRKEQVGGSANQRGQELPDAVQSAVHKQRVGSLFEEHNSALIRLLSIRLNSAEEAKEIAQEAYVKLLGLDEPAAVNHFRAYLFRVATNLAADRLKQRRRRAELRTVAFAGAEKASPSPERALDAAQELSLVREAIGELPDKCKTAFLLHKVHQIPIAETAQRMDLSVRMVRLYVARALAHCAKKLDSAHADDNALTTQASTRSDRHET